MSDGTSDAAILSATGMTPAVRVGVAPVLASPEWEGGCAYAGMVLVIAALGRGLAAAVSLAACLAARSTLNAALRACRRCFRDIAGDFVISGSFAFTSLAACRRS